MKELRPTMAKLPIELMHDAYVMVRQKKKKKRTQFNLLGHFISKNHVILCLILKVPFCASVWNDSSSSSTVEVPVSLIKCFLQINPVPGSLWTRGCVDSAKAGPLGQGLWVGRSPSVKDRCVLLSLTLTSLLSLWAFCSAIIELHVVSHAAGQWARERLWPLTVCGRLCTLPALNKGKTSTMRLPLSIYKELLASWIMPFQDVRVSIPRICECIAL